MNRRLTLDLGTRFEMVRSHATGDITRRRYEHDRSAPGAIFALDGSGRTTVQGSYGHYSGKYGQVQFSSNSNVSRPSEVDYVYSGPAGQGTRVRSRIRFGELYGRVVCEFPDRERAGGQRSPVADCP